MDHEREGGYEWADTGIESRGTLTMLDASHDFAETSFGRSRADRGNGKSARYIHVGSSFANGVVMGNGLVVSEPQKENAISEEAIRDELSRILESSMFVQSDRLGRFLRFTVETTLAGDAEMLKEYLIGTEVYERKPSYNSSEDSIVRSEARRLRRKLKEYY